MIARHEIPAARAAATQATFDAWNGKALDWGKVDCARMAANQVRAFGHRVPLLKFGSYASEPAARAALARQGCKTLAELVDKLGFMPIPFARAWVGDVFALKSEDGLGALGILLGQAQVLMFRNGVCQPCRPGAAFFDSLGGCWRIEMKARPNG